jgi:hypothetical protein
MLDYHAETLLKLEYEYARETIEQATEDRRKVVEFYLLLTGGLGSAALAIAQLDANRAPSVSQLDSVIGPSAHMPGLVFAVLFWLIGLSGFFTLLHLIRLRQAAHESMRSMNRIKEFYVERYPALSDALAWRAHTLPPLNRIGSITFNHALLVIVLASVAFGVGVVFLEVRPQISLVLIALAVGALAFLWQAFIYVWLLREK